MTETERIENKTSLTAWKEIVESVAAFASTDGGTVRVGIAPDGKRVGVAVGKNTIENLANDIKRNTDPPQFPSITWEGNNESAIIAIGIAESPVKPVCAFHRPLKRVGRTNQRLSREEAHRLMDISDGHSWDGLPCTDFAAEDLDWKAVNRFLSGSGGVEQQSFENLLANLSLGRSGVPANGAVLLFARNPQSFFPEAVVKCARFVGVNSAEFIDEQTLEGNLLSQLDGAMAFVKRNTQQRIVISGKPERDVVPEYPEAAVREAITNAVCHREYSWSGTVQVRIYDDRMEVWNPGALPPDLPIEALYREHPSRPRNVHLASALHRVGIMERWGAGTIRIIEAMRQHGLPAPEFRVDMGTFIVRLTRDVGLASRSPSAAPGDREAATLAFVRECGGISTKEYQALFGLGERQSRVDLSALVQRGVLVRREKGPRTTYRLPGDG